MIGLKVRVEAAKISARFNNLFDRSRRSEFLNTPSVLRGGPVNTGVRRLM